MKELLRDNTTVKWKPSQQRPVSTVDKTLKNGILMLKYTSKESEFHADFKYVRFIKFSLCHQKLWAWENLPYFRNRGKHPLKVTEY